MTEIRDGAALTLQRALVAALKADAAVAALTGGRVFDDVPTSAAFPYVSLGTMQEIEDEADCIEGSEIFVDLHVWSRPPGRENGSVEAKRIATAIRRALRQFAPDTGNEPVLLLEYRTTRFMKDQDGMTQHGVITFRALTETTGD